MHRTIKRVLAYTAVMAVCIAVALWTTDTRAGFITVFATGLAFGVVADLLLWWHIFRVTWNRRQTRAR